MRRLFGGRADPVASDPLPTHGVFRILICRVSHSLGNTLLLTPLIRELHATYPGAEIDIVTRSPVANAIFGNFPSIGAIHQLPAWGFRHPWRIAHVLRRVRRQRYDLVIDPCPRSQTDRLLSLLARGRFKLGFANERKAGSISHAVTLPTGIRQTGQLPVALLRTALDRPVSRAFPTLDIGLDPDERARGLALLKAVTGRTDDARGTIGIFANATGTKLLGIEWWNRFLPILESRLGNCDFVEIVPASGRSMLDSRYPAYYSGDIRRLASVLSGLTAYISADCGVMHLAAASGIPTVGIFTHTDPAEWGPYGPGTLAISASGLTPDQTAQCACEFLQELAPHPAFTS